MDADRLCSIIEEAGYPAQAYSGRGMFGRLCVGVPLDNVGEGVRFGMALSEAADDEKERGQLAHLIASTDSLGLGIIYYFPYVNWPKGRRSTHEESEDDNG